MKSFDRIVAGTTERSLVFYDLMKSNEIIGNPVSMISELKGMPLAMDYCDIYETLIVGDE